MSAELAPRLNDTLHRALAQDAEGRCLLLTDPALRPIDAADPGWEAYGELDCLPVRIRHPEIDRSIWPVLAECDTTRFAHSALILHSIDEALAELAPDRLVRGGGRRIGAWLTTSHTTSDVAEHLARLVLQMHPDGSTAWLRLHDPRVLWTLEATLTPTQRGALLGPIAQWWFLDPDGEWVTLASPLTTWQARTQRLSLTPEQWVDIENAEALSIALTSLPDDETASSWRKPLLQGLRRARGYGFDDSADLGAFATRLLHVHPQFDLDSRIQARLKDVVPGSYFTGLVDDVTDAEWATIRTSEKHVS